jgi:hypothetical protein
MSLPRNVSLLRPPSLGINPCAFRVYIVQFL